MVQHPLSLAQSLLLLLTSITFSNTLLAQEECGLPDECKGCPLDFDIKPYPTPTILEKVVGWEFPLQSYYIDTQALGPYCIPVALDVENLDTILVRCAGGCTPYIVPGATQIDWSLPFTPGIPYPFTDGSLVDAHGNRNVMLFDRGIVFYLPPEDLSVGDSITTTLTATVRQKCLPACTVDVTFDVMVVRQAEDHWMFYVGEQNPQPLPEQCDPPPCDGAPGGGCVLLGPNPHPLGPPDYDDTSGDGAKDIPEAMYVDEARPFTFFIKDMDRVRYECGIPVSPGTPCSTFDCKDFCDDLDYYWGIDPVFGWTGDGVFDLTRENSAIFIATAPGRIRIRCDVFSRYASDQNTFFSELEIVPRVERLLDFTQTGQKRITMDGQFDDAYSYWLQGTDPAQTVGVEHLSQASAEDEGVPQRSFPMAYKRGATPEIGLLTLRTEELGTPPSVVTATPMPGMLALGITSTTGLPNAGTIFYAGANDWKKHYEESPSRIEFKKFLVFGTLPDRAGKLSMSIEWHIVAYPNQILDYPTTPVVTTHRIYTTFADPLPVDSTPANDDSLPETVYKHWESMYDISCEGASGSNTAAGALAGLVAKFVTRTLFRKSVDGFLADDGKPLEYYSEWNGSSPAVAKDLKDLLRINPSGSCDAWAQAFRAALAIQGLGGRCIQIDAKLPQRTAFSPPAFNAGVGVQMLVKKWTATTVAASGEARTQGGVPPFPTYTTTDPSRGAQPFHIVDPAHAPGWPLNGNVSATDDIGEPGQGVTNPRSVFSYHMVVRHNGRYYDPSYGSAGGATDWATPEAWAMASLFGVLMKDKATLERFDIFNSSGLPAAIEVYVGAAGAPLFPITVKGF